MTSNIISQYKTRKHLHDVTYKNGWVSEDEYQRAEAQIFLDGIESLQDLGLDEETAWEMMKDALKDSQKSEVL